MNFHVKLWFTCSTISLSLSSTMQRESAPPRVSGSRAEGETLDRRSRFLFGRGKMGRSVFGKNRKQDVEFVVGLIRAGLAWRDGNFPALQVRLAGILNTLTHGAERLEILLDERIFFEKAHHAGELQPAQKIVGFVNCPTLCRRPVQVFQIKFGLTKNDFQHELQINSCLLGVRRNDSR